MSTVSPPAAWCSHSSNSRFVSGERIYKNAEMQKAADAADISVLFFSAGANFGAILGHLWAILPILGNFWANLGYFG